MIVYKRTGSAVDMQAPRDEWWHDVIQGQAEECEPTWVNAEHPLFILYTSGSTGKPKGVQHSTGGYLLQAVMTMKWVFDYKPSDVFWCTADVGWVTGHTLHHLRAARGGCHRGHVRRHTDLSRCGALLENHPGPQGERVLYRAHRDPFPHQGGRRPAEKIRSEIAAHPGHGGRTDQSRSVDVVSQRGRRYALPDRRYLVADRNRRAHDLPAARRDADQARLLHLSAAGNHGRDRGRDRDRKWRRARAESW